MTRIVKTRANSAKNADRLMSVLARQRSLSKVSQGMPPIVKKQKNARVRDRQPSFKYARIQMSDGKLQKCVVVDYNEFGVRIRLEGQDRAPTRTEIRVPELGLRRTAILRWQLGRDAGFAYVV